MPTALGIYIFAGGFSLGVSRYFDIAGHLEDGTFGTETFKANFPSVPVNVQLASWDLAQYKGGVDFVYANPPCIGWSSIGKAWRGKDKEAWRKDTRVSCTMVVAQALRDIQPKVWAFESVQNLMTRGAEVVSGITRDAVNLGYHVYYALHDTKFMGLAQHRRRVFVVASKVAIDWEAPDGYVVPSKVVFDEFKDNPGHVFAMRLAHIPLAEKLQPRESLLTAWEREHPNARKEAIEAGIKQLRGRPRFMDHRLDPELPCSTIVGMVPPAQIHPYEPRYVGQNELAAFCGFPNDWVWAKSPWDTLLEIARGVTVTAGEWLGYNVSRALAANRPIAPGATLVNFSGKQKWVRCMEMQETVVPNYDAYLYTQPKLEV